MARTAASCQPESIDTSTPETCTLIRSRASKSAPVGVVSKILRLLEALNASSTGLRLKDIAEQTAMNKSTAYRFLAHLETERYLYRDEYGAYMVAPKVGPLGSWPASPAVA